MPYRLLVFLLHRQIFTQNLVSLNRQLLIRNLFTVFNEIFIINIDCTIIVVMLTFFSFKLMQMNRHFYDMFTQLTIFHQFYLQHNFIYSFFCDHFHRLFFSECLHFFGFSDLLIIIIYRYFCPFFLFIISKRS